MPKVTKEMMKDFFLSGIMPPRHQHGCPKNYLRTMPLPLLAHGLTLTEIEAKIQKESAGLPCRCR